MQKKITFSILIVMLLFHFNCKKNETVQQVFETKILPVIQSFLSSASEVNYKMEVTISWVVTNATSVEIQPGIGSVATSGEVTIQMKKDTSFTLSARNNDGSTAKGLTVKVNPAAYITLIDSSIKYKYKSYGSCSLEGKVKNEGNRTGWNSAIRFTAYDGSNTIIDDAFGSIAGLNNVPPGVRAVFEAIFFDTYDWARIKKITYSISWLSREGYIVSKQGMIRVN